MARSAAKAPIRYLHEAALRIQRGESVVGAVCGAEAQSTVNKAEKAGVKLPWTPFAEHGVQSVRSASWQHPLAIALGVFQPITVYPFYDAATAAHWGQTPREALREVRRVVVDLLGRRREKSAFVAEARVRCRRRS